MIFDLHVHTTASDGIYSPSDVIDKAHELGLGGLAITDHDTVNGLKEARKHVENYAENLILIPGIEMNTDYKENEVHILGYFINSEDTTLLNRLEEIKQARTERALKMIHRLHAMGMKISFEQVKKFAHGDLIARPHIAQALQEKGYVFSIKEAFEKYIGRDKPGYVPRYKFLPGEAIELIKNAGGISSLAHPRLIKNPNIIAEVIKMGVDGLEVHYSDHSLNQEQEFMNLSKKYKLLVTGGSDFHGSENKANLGCKGLNKCEMDELINFYYDNLL